MRWRSRGNRDGPGAWQRWRGWAGRWVSDSRTAPDDWRAAQV